MTSRLAPLSLFALLAALPLRADSVYCEARPCDGVPKKLCYGPRLDRCEGVYLSRYAGRSVQLLSATRGSASLDGTSPVLVAANQRAGCPQRLRVAAALAGGQRFEMLLEAPECQPEGFSYAWTRSTLPELARRLGVSLDPQDLWVLATSPDSSDSLLRVLPMRVGAASTADGVADYHFVFQTLDPFRVVSAQLEPVSPEAAWAPVTLEVEEVLSGQPFTLSWPASTVPEGGVLLTLLGWREVPGHSEALERLVLTRVLFHHDALVP